MAGGDRRRPFSSENPGGCLECAILLFAGFLMGAPKILLRYSTSPEQIETLYADSAARSGWQHINEDNPRLPDPISLSEVNLDFDGLQSDYDFMWQFRVSGSNYRGVAISRTKNEIVYFSTYTD
jgi:hypothetical protein